MVLLTLICIALILNFVWMLTDPLPVQKRVSYIFKKKNHLTYLTFVTLLLALVVTAYIFPINISLENNKILERLGISIAIVGAYLCIWAKYTMNINWGPPAQHDIEKQSKLVTDGPFRFSRNPIYVGMLLVAIGYAVALQSLAFPLIIIHFFNTRKVILIEEDLLEKHFGSRYLQYKKQVHRFL